VTYQELTNQEKQLMLFDALPKDYIDHMKKENQVPLEMPLEELRSHSLNIEETKVNEVKNSNLTETKDNSNNNNHTPSQKNGKRNGKGKFKKGKNNGQEIMHLRFLMGKQGLCVPFVEILVMLKTPVELKKEQWRRPNNSLRKKPRNVRNTTLKKLNHLQLQPKKQRLPVPPIIMILMMTSLISMIS
jgi:hypothetical protein